MSCYTLTVPENRADPDSRTLRLAVAVAAATGDDPAEPILYLHGGPGIATLDGLARRLASPPWRRLRERHALVFMDYRGTGQSEPVWCPDLEDAVRAIDRENPTDDERTARTAAAFAACRDAMEDDALDLAGYGSDALAADAEAARRALGLPPWTVYGVSFGTHVALNLVRDHPEGVRALLLDSVFPPNAPYLDWVRPMAAGLDVLAARCAEDAACATRVPDVRAAFRAAVARLDADPLAVAVDTTGRTDRVDGRDFAWIVWTALLNPRHIPLVPLALEAGAARDSVALTAWARRFIDPDAFGSNASAQFYAVWCTEGRPRTPEQTAGAALAAHPELAAFVVPGLEDAVCDAWQPHRAPASAADAIVSDVPTLVLTGEYDPVTRPADGHLAAATLARAQVLDVPGASHAALHADACTYGLAAAFLDAPTEPLDTSCLAERPPLRFVTTGTLAEALAPPGAHLFVWAGDAEHTDPDFLAVLDADPASPTYGAVVTTLAVDAAGTYPHHTDHAMPADGVLWANGFGSGDVFRFDLRDPSAPRLLGRFVVGGPFMHPHSFSRLADGHVLATLQMRGHANAEAGALVELDAEGRVVRTADAADPEVEPFIRPYSLAVVPALDRVVTTSADMHEAEPSHVVQVWRQSDLRRVATVRLPPGPRGDEGVDPAEPRVLADGRTVLVSTFSCGLYRLDALDTDVPTVRFVYGFGGAGCALPVVSGRFWVQTVPAEHALVALDVSDPDHPREVGRLTLAETDGPHWIALDPSGTRIAISGGSGTLERRVLIATLDPQTGALALDARFHDAGVDAPGVTFDRPAWPHGATGPATPHGAVFSLPSH